jgi:mitochondrial fission protein ELM1
VAIVVDPTPPHDAATSFRSIADAFPDTRDDPVTDSSSTASPDSPRSPAGRVARLTWVITEGAAGMENQAVGLAEAIGLPVVVKRVRVRMPWRKAPGRLWPAPLSLVTPGSDPLAPPWPDLVITCGRQSAPLGAAIRRATGARCLAVHVQDPKYPLGAFDLVVPPRHDGLAGANVMATDGALNRVTPARLADGARRLTPRLGTLPRPRVAVLIGGTSNSYRLTAAAMDRLAGQLATLAGDKGAGLMITPSRRTGPENVAILRRRLAGLPCFVWDGTGDNPYFGFLGLADAIVVTAESASMVSEAATTGKPVYVATLEGGSRRFHSFHARLRERGATRPFAGELETWTYPPLDDTARVARAVRERLASRS